MSHISLRLTDDQRERLEMVAEARGLDRSSLLRRLIDEASLTREERDRLPGTPELLRLLAERARAGNVGAIRALLDRAERDAPEFSEFDALDGLQELHAVRRTGLAPSTDLPPDDDWQLGTHNPKGGAR